MAKRSKAIITCAVTGGGYTPTMSPHLPITPEEIAGASLAAAQAGAAMLHLHAREPHTGRPSADPDLFFQFLPRIGADTNAVVIINTGGVQGMPIEDRLAPALRAKPEMCSFNLGAMCIGLFPLQDRFKEWKYTWEPEHLEKSRGVPTGNTFKDVERILRDLGEGCGTRFEFECYDVGHLHNLAHLLERRLVEPPLFVQCAFGFLGGIGPDAENVLHMRRVANSLFGEDYVWSVMATRRQVQTTTLGAIMGASVRVGLEDSLHLVNERLAISNAEQVAKVRRILEELGLEIATAAEARDVLKLKGHANVAF